MIGEVCRRGTGRKESDIRNLEKACLKLHAEGISPQGITGKRQKWGSWGQGCGLQIQCGRGGGMSRVCRAEWEPSRMELLARGRQWTPLGSLLGLCGHTALLDLKPSGF